MKTMYIIDSLHEKITSLAKSETERRGKFVSLSDMLEELVEIGFVSIDRANAEKASSDSEIDNNNGGNK